MEKKKFQITMPDLQQIIKEEYAAMAKDNARAEEIKSRLNAINEELEGAPETLSEVEASGTKKTKSTGWSGDGGDTKYGEKFEKIGTHLKEDEEFGGEMEMGGEEESIGDSMEGPAEPEMGYFEMKFADLGKELDAKIGGEEAEEAGIEVNMGNMDGETEDSGMEEMSAMQEEAVEEGAEVVAEMEETKHEPLEGPKVNPENLSEEAVEEGAEVVAEEVVEEAIEEVVEEGAEIVAEEVVEEDCGEDHEELEEGVEVVSEDLEEPIEGSTPAQDSKARFNDYMEKDTHVKEGVQKVNTSLLSEGYSPEKKSKMDAELERMKKLARI